MAAESKTEDQVLTLNAAESRAAFDAEVQHRLHIDAQTFLDQWQAGGLDQQDPDVAFLLCLAPLFCPAPDRA